VNRFVVFVPCPRRHPQPDAVLLKSHRGFVVEASLCLGPGPRADPPGVSAGVLASRGVSCSWSGYL
jgi:hypothetical protein